MNAQIGDGRLGCACYARGPALDLFLPEAAADRIEDAKKHGATVQIVETIPLVQAELIPNTDIELRVGTREVTLKCGLFSVRVTASWLNPKTSGYLGAAEFPVVEVTAENATVLAPTSFGYCVASESMFTDAGCPGKWATSVLVSWDADRHQALIKAERSFSEERTVQLTPRVATSTRPPAGSTPAD